MNRIKSKVLIPSAVEGLPNLNDRSAGLPQVYGTLEMLGGAVEGQFATGVGLISPLMPAAAQKRLQSAQELATKINLM